MPGLEQVSVEDRHRGVAGFQDKVGSLHSQVRFFDRLHFQREFPAHLRAKGFTVFRARAEDTDAPKVHDLGEGFKVRVGLVAAPEQSQRVRVRTHEELCTNDACGGGSIINALLISPPPYDRRKFGCVRIV